MKGKAGRKLLLLILAAVMSLVPVRAQASEWYDGWGLESTGNSTFDEFINNPNYTMGAPWGPDQRPLLSAGGGRGCASYCPDFVKYCYGLDGITSQDIFYNADEIRAGDVIHVQSTYGHWFVVLRREGNMLYTAEGNWNDSVRISWGYSIVDNEIVGGRHAFDRGYHFLPEMSEGGWEEDENGWRYAYGGGFYAQSAWLNEGDNWYLAGIDGYLLTGWQMLDNKWYYFSPNGLLIKGWKRIDRKWYYFDDDGVMVKGWQLIDGDWYYFAGGAMVKGWKKLSGNWYYFLQGAMVTGSLEIGGVEYSFDEEGAWIEE